VTKESFRGARGFIRVERLIQRFNSFHISGSVRCVSAWGKKLSLTGCLEVDNVFVCDILCMYAMLLTFLILVPSFLFVAAIFEARGGSYRIGPCTDPGTRCPDQGRM
jgi:hypothetical protein